MYLITSTIAKMSPKIPTIRTTPPATFPLDSVKNGPFPSSVNAKASKAKQSSEAADLQSARRIFSNRRISCAAAPLLLESRTDTGHVLKSPTARKTSAMTTRALPTKSKMDVSDTA